MPTVLRLRGYRFFFFSLEGTEPPHIHIEKAGNYAKFWLSPVMLARTRGFRASELRELREIVEAKQSLFEDKWNEHFGH